MTALPDKAVQEHAMSSFPHTLIGLGPFANLGCKIIFTKTAVSVIHSDGHSIIEGWQELEGPCLRHFLLISKPINTLIYPPQPQSTHVPHQHGFNAIDEDGHACNVEYMYGEDTSLSVAAQTSTTPFDTHALDLPSVRALISQSKPHGLQPSQKRQYR